jgi:peptidoglycan DL-endopeptidase CwlO
VTVVLLGLALAVPTVCATANASTTRTTSTVAAKVLSIAASQYGKPYHYGASGPSSFDCSGFTSYVFRKVGISLPHSSSAQYGVVHHIAKANKRPGDLIFMYGSGGIYHVAIYAGNNQMWAATHTGDIVRKETIYSSSYLVGRA